MAGSFLGGMYWQIYGKKDFIKAESIAGSAMPIFETLATVAIGIPIKIILWFFPSLSK